MTSYFLLLRQLIERWGRQFAAFRSACTFQVPVATYLGLYSAQKQLRRSAVPTRGQRLVVDYERKVQTSETLIEVAMMRLLIARLGKRHDPEPDEKRNLAKVR